MIKKIINRIKSKLCEKKGATMIVVITTMTLLMIIGSGFATLAFQSYRHSYGSLCRQQALFTAKGVLDGFIDEFKINQNLRENVIKTLEETIATNPETDVTKIDAEINIKNLHDYMADSGAFATADEQKEEAGNNTKDCMMYVSYSDKSRTKLKLTVAAKYKGFYNSLSVILGYTNKASYELSKIMSNTLYFMTPVINLAIDQIQGDVYIDKNENGDHDGNGIDDFYESVKALHAFTTVNEIMTGGSTLKIDLFGNKTGKAAEWVEVFIRTWKTFTSGNWQDIPTAIVGSLKCNTSVLLGLADRCSQGAMHSFRNATGYDSKVGQNLNHTCLKVSEDIYVNGNARGENFICKNLFVTDNIADSEYMGNIVAECQEGVGLGGFAFNSHIVVENDVRADGFVVIHGGTSGIVGGDIYAGRYNQDGRIWGNPGFGDIKSDNGGYKHGTGDVELTYTDVNGNIYAEGNVIIKDASTVKGNVYAKGDVYIKNSNINGNVYCGGNLTVLEERNGRRHVVGGTTTVGGSLSVKGNYANLDTFVHLDGDVSVKGDITLYDRASLGGNNKKAKIYCGGNFHMENDSVLDDSNGYVVIKGDAYIGYECRVKPSIYVYGNVTIKVEKSNYNVESMRRGIFKPVYAVGWIKSLGDNYIYGGYKKPCMFSNNPAGSDLNSFWYYDGFWKGWERHGTPASLSSQVDVYRNGKFTLDTVENNPYFINLGAFIRDEIDKANKSEEEINKRLVLYSKTVNAMVKKWSSPKPVTAQEGGDYVQGGAVYPKVGGAISATDNTYRVPDNPNEFIIDCNILNLQKIELSANQVLTIDTSKKNIHIVLTGDLKVGTGATIKVRGSNMAFIYLEGLNRQYVEFGNESRIGLVEAVDGASTKNAGLHIISNKYDLDFTVGKRLDIRSFNYIPYGYLNIAGGKNTVYSGSFVIGYIDIGGWSSSVFESSYVKFNGEKSPLILDITNDMQYGDTIGEIQDFGQISWDIIDYV